MKVSFTIFYNALTLFVLLQSLLSSFCYFDLHKPQDDAARGVRFSGNDKFTVFAINLYQQWVLAFHPYKPLDYCTISYRKPPTTDYLDVWSLTVISDNDNTTLSELHRFVQAVGHKETNGFSWTLTVFAVNKSSCGLYDLHSTKVSPIAHQNQDYLLLKLDPSQKYVYLFVGSLILSYNIHDLTAFESNDMSTIMNSTFAICAAELTDSYAILVGLLDAPGMNNFVSFQAVLIALHPIRVIHTINLSDGDLFVNDWTDSSNKDMSVAMNPTRTMAIVGLPFLNKVVVLSINTISSLYSEWTLHVTRNDSDIPRTTAGFGRSLAWIDDATVAVAVLTVVDRQWSESEVWIFAADKPLKIPLFVFPNTQQKIALKRRPLFHQILSWSGNLLLLTDLHKVLLVPSVPAGFLSVWNSYSTHHILVFNSAPCVAGTYKNTSSFGPCTVCPPQTKNTGSQPCSKCESCTPTSFCPRGSIGEISLDTYPSYTQTFSYPDTPDMNNYDDLLVQNFFTIGRSSRCVVISPLFWTIIVIILCFIVWFLMILPKMYNCPKAQSRRNRAKRFLKKTDIVNEGEHWIGGLFSLAIVLLFGFTFWFASEFLKLYPIETSGISYISCDDTVRNAVFDSALQLPLPNPDGSQFAIFEMLDAQSFKMTLDLLNTLADCSSISVQQNRPGRDHVRLPIISCILQQDNATRSFSFMLPAHRTNVQINIVGPFFVGGMRLCLHGSGIVDGVNTLQTLDMCQLFLTANETLSRMTTLHIVLVKVINITKPLQVGDDTYYDGRWAPTFAERSLSDESIYEEDGHYLRYIFEGTILEFTLSEQPFYLQNIQQPIVRRAELAFHTLLFCTLIIELFGMGFLICRLVIMPLIRVVLRCRHLKKRSNNMEETPRPLTM